LRPGSRGQIQVRLVEDAEKTGKYACLSRRWGPSTASCLTTRANLGDCTQNIPWDFLPRMFQQAVSITAALRLKYLWIDSICIVQDNDSDWKIRAAQMCDIYYDSYVTLAASLAIDSDVGLFNPQEPIFISHSIAKYNPCFVRFTKHPYFYSAEEEEVEKGPPLLGRASVFQERLLSRRFLQFLDNELY
jgi:hypothetical protein